MIRLETLSKKLEEVETEARALALDTKQFDEPDSS